MAQKLLDLKREASSAQKQMEKDKNQETTKLYQEDKTLKKELQLTSAKKGQGILGKFKLGLKKTKEILVDDLKEALLGDEELDEILFDEIEENLLSADIGVPTTRRILAKLEELYAKGKIKFHKDGKNPGDVWG